MAHGMSRTPEYQAWNHMKLRCTKVDHHNYPNYGARGITVCKAWTASFSAFLADVGPRPGPGYSLERLDNSGNYEPGNCVWTTAKSQARNRRNNHLLTWSGTTATIAEWAEKTAIARATIRKRITDGWTVDAALTTPVQPRRPRRPEK